MFKEDFEKPQQEIAKVNSNNLVITKQETGKLREEIDELKKNNELTENVLQNKISKVDQNACELQGKVTKFDECVKYMKDCIEDIKNIHNKLVELVRDEIT